MDGQGQYGMAPDMGRQFMNTITTTLVPGHYPCHLVPGAISPPSHYVNTPAAMLMASGAGAPSSSTTGTTHGYFELETCNNGRWPRQETLSLLEIRSNLHSKFKLANHKGPLWDEVSRIMVEEHGYQRSGKKCREKFENLYKYYKKTKDGKAGRQDGKHYRFFKQLEALYGTDQQQQPTNPNINSLSESHFLGELEISSNNSNDDQDLTQIKEFMDSQMRKLMKKQEEWLGKMIKTMDRRDEERVLKEEEWRKQDAVRVEKEYLFWAKERAWIESRNASLMEVLKKLTGKEPSNLEMNIDQPNHYQFDASCVSNGIQDGYSRFLMMGEGDHNLWGNYGLNLNKEEHN